MSAVRKLPEATSVYLDLIRFVAAVAVAYGHLTQKYFSSGWAERTTLAVHAVGIFFVLSGFVVRYVTRLKRHSIGEYWIDRGARIYSVVLPAVLFTVVADTVSCLASPSFYLGNWSGNLDRPWLRLLTNLTFTSQVWSHSIALFSNGPFWSLSYECFYYALYGCFFYLSGTLRIGLLFLVAALAGPHILFLLPLWLLGCAAFDIYRSIVVSSWPAWKVHAGMAVAALAGAALWTPAYRLIFMAKSALAELFVAHRHAPVNLHWTLDYYQVGVPAAFLMLWSALALETRRQPLPKTAAVAIRRLAESSFSLYLFHFPLYVLFASLVRYGPRNGWVKLGMLALAIGLALLVARPLDGFKTFLRCRLRALCTRQPQAAASGPMTPEPELSLAASFHTIG
jgi:peptidoglycan/LPS O-acetylase OafA/YrhL